MPCQGCLAERGLSLSRTRGSRTRGPIDQASPLQYVESGMGAAGRVYARGAPQAAALPRAVRVGRRQVLGVDPPDPIAAEAGESHLAPGLLAGAGEPDAAALGLACMHHRGVGRGAVVHLEALALGHPRRLPVRGQMRAPAMGARLLRLDALEGGII